MTYLPAAQGGSAPLAGAALCATEFQGTALRPPHGPVPVLLCSWRSLPVPAPPPQLLLACQVHLLQHTSTSSPAAERLTSAVLWNSKPCKVGQDSAPKLHMRQHMSPPAFSFLVIPAAPSEMPVHISARPVSAESPPEVAQYGLGRPRIADAMLCSQPPTANSSTCFGQILQDGR